MEDLEWIPQECLRVVRDGVGSAPDRNEKGPMATVRAAVVQAAPVAFDCDRTLDRVRTLADEAARLGAQLIVFPEAFVSGYPRGLDFGTRVGSRSAEGREQFRRYWESAIEVPGPATTALGDCARNANAHMVIGVIERAGGRSIARSCSSPLTVACWASIASSCPRRPSGSFGGSATARRCPCWTRRSAGWGR